MPFRSLGLLPALVTALEEAGYAVPSTVQLAAIPVALEGHDALVSAQTGSGKTAAYVLPLLQKLMLARDPSGTAAQPGHRRPRLPDALVLVPTRELAMQVAESVQAFSKSSPLNQQSTFFVKTVALFGGVSVNPQMLALRGGANIVIATPGRLLDLVKRNALQLGSIRSLVLDEADRLLDLGFGEELSGILALLPPKRQNLFFSATFPPAIEALASSMLRNPQKISCEASAGTELNMLQRAIRVDAARRTQLLRHLVQTEKWPRALVFVATKHAAETVADKLRKAGIPAEPFHGELSQGKRSQVLMDLKGSRVQVVVATDVAARGIDIAELPVVVNYDLPRSSVDYTHRVGRTARAGESGCAISFVTEASQAHWRLIEKRNQLNLVSEEIAGFEPSVALATSAVDPMGTGGIKGSRPSKKDKLRAQQAATSPHQQNP